MEHGSESSLNADIDRAVIAAERQRCDAMLANDMPALDAMLDERLHFAHANGAVDGKEDYLAKMAAGRIRYIGIEWSEQKIVPLAPDAAMLAGRMTTDVRVEGTDKRLDNRVITLWRRDAGGGWRLVAFQSTPLAA